MARKKRYSATEPTIEIGVVEEIPFDEEIDTTKPKIANGKVKFVRGKTVYFYIDNIGFEKKLLNTNDIGSTIAVSYEGTIGTPDFKIISIC